MNWLFFVHWNDTLTLKCVNFVNFVNFWKEKSHRFRDGIFLFIRSRIYSSFRGPRKSLIFGERKNDGALISIHRNPLAKSILTRGIFRRWLLSCILFGRVRLGLCRVVGLLQRAEESCEGLKHGYYDLPCVYFLIFLCHDI